MADTTSVSVSGTTDLSSLPAELKSDPGLKDFKSVEDLAKSFVNLQKMLGNSIRPPGPDATPEDRKKFAEDLKAKIPGLIDQSDTDAMWATLGRPKTPEAYEPPQNVKVSDAELMAVRKFALENGLTKTQAEALFKQRAQATETSLAQQALWNEQLKKEWGTATEERKALAIVQAEKMGAPTALIEAARAGNASPETMKWLYSVAKAIGPGEGTQLAREPGTQRTPDMTPQEAESQIAELMKNPAWRNESDPQHQAMIRKMVGLVEVANMGKEVGDGVGHIISLTGVAPPQR